MKDILGVIRDEIKHLFSSCEQEETPAEQKVATVTVVAGDTLYGITEKALTRDGKPGDGGRWIEMRPLNPQLMQEGAEKRIQPGDVIRIPASWLT